MVSLFNPQILNNKNPASCPAPKERPEIAAVSNFPRDRDNTSPYSGGGFCCRIFGNAQQKILPRPAPLCPPPCSVCWLPSRSQSPSLCVGRAERQVGGSETHSVKTPSLARSETTDWDCRSPAVYLLYNHCQVSLFCLSFPS